MIGPYGHSSLIFSRITIPLLLCVFSLVLTSTSLCAQDEEPIYVVRAVVIEGDTIPMVFLSEFSISDRRSAKSRREQRRYDRIKKKVLKAYPYAVVTRDLLEEFDRELLSLTSEKEKKKFVDKAEVELKEEFEGELKNLTMSEGRILIKLIDRETGNTSFELIKQLKGGFNAFMWQSVAKIFGSDLKSEYDPGGKDAAIEGIVQAIERGELKVPPREAVSTKAQKRLDRKKKREKKKEKKNA